MQTLEDLELALPVKTARKPSNNRLYFGLLNLAATIQLVWFYVVHVPQYLDTVAYENGVERSPFQYRLLMAYPLHWAHANRLLNFIAAYLSAIPPWFPQRVHPEDIVESVVGVACVATAGLVARAIYKTSSRTGLYTSLVYPLTLALAAITYCLITLDYFRFPYDLPSLGLFSIGIYLIYFRRSSVLFSALFLVATVNRETSIFLLLFYAISEGFDGIRFQWRRLLAWRPVLLIVLLGSYWLALRIWAVHHFASNPHESKPIANWPRVAANASFAVSINAWPQMLSVCAYLLPFVLLNRRRIADPHLRAWLWVLPAWVLVMLFYGMIFEVRIYGELIPFFAVLVALTGEEVVWATLKHRPRE
jgi:hypothetical protein